MRTKTRLVIDLCVLAVLVAIGAAVGWACQPSPAKAPGKAALQVGRAVCEGVLVEVDDAEVRAVCVGVEVLDALAAQVLTERRRLALPIPGDAGSPEAAPEAGRLKFALPRDGGSGDAEAEN